MGKFTDSVKKAANDHFWIQKAIKKPGQLLGVPQGKKIPAGMMAKAAKKGGKVGQRARFAMTMKEMK